MSAAASSKMPGGGGQPPHRPKKDLPPAHYDDNALRKVYRKTGVREKDRLCPSCLESKDWNHRQHWRRCKGRCPVCPFSRQHPERLCPHMICVETNPSWWRFRLSMERPRDRTARPEARQEARASLRPNNARGTAGNDALGTADGDAAKPDIATSAPSTTSLGFRKDEPTSNNKIEQTVQELRQQLEWQQHEIAASQQREQTLLQLLAHLQGNLNSANHVPLPPHLQTFVQEQATLFKSFRASNNAVSESRSPNIRNGPSSSTTDDRITMLDANEATEDAANSGSRIRNS
ncbi:hypothetical protein BU23DRAFT_641523 [Bimuria novae-zelandiae CBS 107.79]|uniref:Uncharacterized protein n=1 Tax=Bimuria novae-zelandiae CBS 107.79 TaxID=1447943 RepID=A0A6A5V7H7_9PLEO|nr:hypothetical protein BU23DRAFT_641523 [Bimuria novae-zelandiae CBS 107.79]